MLAFYPIAQALSILPPDAKGSSLQKVTLMAASVGTVAMIASRSFKSASFLLGALLTGVSLLGSYTLIELSKSALSYPASPLVQREPAKLTATHVSRLIQHLSSLGENLQKLFFALKKSSLSPLSTDNERRFEEEKATIDCLSALSSGEFTSARSMMSAHQTMEEFIQASSNIVYSFSMDVLPPEESISPSESLDEGSASSSPSRSDPLPLPQAKITELESDYDLMVSTTLGETKEEPKPEKSPEGSPAPSPKTPTRKRTLSEEHGMGLGATGTAGQISSNNESPWSALALEESSSARSQSSLS